MQKIEAFLKTMVLLGKFGETALTVPLWLILLIVVLAVTSREITINRQ